MMNVLVLILYDLCLFGFMWIIDLSKMFENLIREVHLAVIVSLRKLAKLSTKN